MKNRFHFLSLFFLSAFIFTSPVFATEFSLHQLEKAALTYAGIDPQEVRSWKSHAKWAAALPKVLVGYDQKSSAEINNTIQDSISVSSAGVTVGPPDSSLDQNNDFNRGFEVRATWDLGELVFNRDNLSISSESRSRTIVRNQVLDELHQAWFERKRLLLNMSDSPSPTAKLKLEELEARLDSLTGGYFSQFNSGENHE